MQASLARLQFIVDPLNEAETPALTGKLVDVVYNPKTGQREYKDVPPAG